MCGSPPTRLTCRWSGVNNDDDPPYSQPADPVHGAGVDRGSSAGLVLPAHSGHGRYRPLHAEGRPAQLGRSIPDIQRDLPRYHHRQSDQRRANPTGCAGDLEYRNRYKIPVDASANVHSVSGVGEQYLDLVSTGSPGKFLSPGQTITKVTVPSPIGPTLDAANRALAVLPKHKISSLLDETAQG